MSKENDSIRIPKQWMSTIRDDRINKRWLTTAGISKGTLITLNVTDNQERENFYHFYHVHEGFIIIIVSLLNYLMKILVGFDIFSCVIFKD